MYAISITEYGDADVLRGFEFPDPMITSDEILIEVVAGGVNRGDVFQREGRYPPPPGAPLHPGLECSGHVVEIGSEVTGFARGDAVCALLGGGGYAEKVAVPAGQVLPVPAGVDVADAAALPEAACTVWENLVGLGHLRAGETLLVHGGGSGIGTFAVQLGVALGARVLATARRPKHDVIRALGADRVIDYTDEDFVTAAHEFGGADVVLDIVGGAYLDRNLDSLAAGGRLVVIGMQGGNLGELDVRKVLAKRACITGSSLRGRLPAEKSTIVRAVRENVWPLIEASRIRPVVDRRLPLAEAATAHRLLEAGEPIGKLLLTT